jgi:hypothetical protein
LIHDAEQALQRLLSYCREKRWAGYDLYDGLNSPILRLLPIRGKLFRTIWIQSVNRSPLNLRPLLGIKQGLNPKGVALAIKSLVLLKGLSGRQTLGGRSGQGIPRPGPGRLEEDLSFLNRSLVELRSPGYQESCWGYTFDWQSRAFFAPRGTPNVVCTTFAASANMDIYEKEGASDTLAAAESSCRFLLDRINRTEQGDRHCFSYTPLDRSRVHNVNMLAAELLARVHTASPRDEYRDAAIKAVGYTLARQSADGSWPYGEAADQQWIDSFHTGFILISLKRIIQALGIPEWNSNLERGYEFYTRNLFLADHTPKYYHDRLFPLDVHSAAVAVLVFLEMTEMSTDARARAEGVLSWAIENLQDPTEGFFYYQRRRFYTNRTPLIRWAQAWMLYALSSYVASDRDRSNG